MSCACGSIITMIMLLRKPMTKNRINTNQTINIVLLQRRIVHAEGVPEEEKLTEGTDGMPGVCFSSVHKVACLLQST